MGNSYEDTFVLQSLPFGKRIKGSRKIDQIDAIYIPTISSRPLPETAISFLLQYTPKIKFLFSGEPSSWFKQFESNTKVQIVATDALDFIDEYKNWKPNNNYSVQLRPQFDIPYKRSYALKDARKNDYKYILLLDDDITMTEENVISGLSSLGNGATVVGFHVLKYPDVSTIDHIERILKQKPSEISMTGSCLFLDVDRINSFFPSIYNDDLFFFMAQKDAKNVVSGGNVIQRKYYPWKDLQRVAHEQFGDLIYEAYKKLWKTKKDSILDWDKEIETRCTRIKELLEIAMKKEPLFVEALQIALENTANINRDNIMQFVSSFSWADWSVK